MSSKNFEVRYVPRFANKKLKMPENSIPSRFCAVVGILEKIALSCITIAWQRLDSTFILKQKGNTLSLVQLVALVPISRRLSVPRSVIIFTTKTFFPNFSGPNASLK
jgi:hypothetical protein